MSGGIQKKRYTVMNISEESEGGTAVVPPIICCRKCGAAIAGNVNYCSNCGAKQNAGDAWYYRPVWILLLALFVLGPFALPLVWKSKRMGPGFKVLMAAMILIYTAYCVYFTYKVVVFQVREMGELNRLLQQIRKP